MSKTIQDSKRDVETEQRIGKFVRDFSIAVQDEQSVNYNILRKMLRELLASEISKAREEGREEAEDLYTKGHKKWKATIQPATKDIGNMKPYTN